MNISMERPTSELLQRFLTDRREYQMWIGFDRRKFVMEYITQKHHLIRRLRLLVRKKRNRVQKRNEQGQPHRENCGDRRIGKRFHASAGD